MSENTPIQNLPILAQQQKRPRYVLPIPASLQMLPSDPKVSMTLGMTSVADEQEASKAADNKRTNIAYELFYRSLLEVDGQTISNAAGEKEALVESWSPRVREIGLKAFYKIHRLSEEESASFLDKMVLTGI